MSQLSLNRSITPVIGHYSNAIDSVDVGLCKNFPDQLMSFYYSDPIKFDKNYFSSKCFSMS